VVIQGTKRQVEKAVAMLDMFGDGSKMIEEGMLFRGQSKRGTVISIRELAGKGYIKPDAEYRLDHDCWFEFKTDLNPDVRPEQVSVGNGGRVLRAQGQVRQFSHGLCADAGRADQGPRVSRPFCPSRKRTPHPWVLG
jgi:hypothetical protein